MSAVVISMIFTSLGLFWFGLVALFSSVGYSCDENDQSVSRWKSFAGSILALLFAWLIWNMRYNLKEWGDGLSKHMSTTRTQWGVRGGVDDDSDFQDKDFAKDVSVWMGWVVSIAGGMAVIYPVLVGWILAKLIIPISGLSVGPFKFKGRCKSANFLGDLVDVMQPVTSIFILWIAALGVMFIFAIFQWNHFTGLSHSSKESFF